MLVLRCHRVYQKKYTFSPQQVLKKRNCWLVLQYYQSNKVLSLEKNAHCLPILFLPFSSESRLLKDCSYCDRLSELDVLERVKRNPRKFESDCEIIDSIYRQICKNANDSKRVIFTETSSPK